MHIPCTGAVFAIGRVAVLAVLRLQIVMPFGRSGRLLRKNLQLFPYTMSESAIETRAIHLFFLSKQIYLSSSNCFAK